MITAGPPFLFGPGVSTVAKSSTLKYLNDSIRLEQHAGGADESADHTARRAYAESDDRAAGNSEGRGGAGAPSRTRTGGHGGARRSPVLDRGAGDCGARRAIGGDSIECAA